MRMNREEYFEAFIGPLHPDQRKLIKQLDELAKYKRAFEILGNHMFVPFGLFNERTGKINYYFGTNYSKHKLTKEEYELLEELFKGLEN